MSRIPPQIEQVIDGKKVKGWHIVPIFDTEGCRYELSDESACDKSHKPIGFYLFVSAYSSDGVLKWRVCYYSKTYIPMLETDVQDDFPVDFFIEGDTIIIKLEHYSENDRIFYIMKDDGDIKMKSPY